MRTGAGRTVWMAADGPSFSGGTDSAENRSSASLGGDTASLTSRAELLGVARRLVPPLAGADSSASLELGAPLPLSRLAAPLNWGRNPAALSPTIARFLADDSADSMIRPLTLLDRVAAPSSPESAGGTAPATFVFARVRRKSLLSEPARPEPSWPASPMPFAVIDAGRPLPSEERSAMETVIGTGLAEVRIHTGPAAAAMASMLRAEAFTIGRDVFFGPGRYDPMSPRGRALLAHELTHVRQQTVTAERVQRYGDDPDAAEAEAVAVEQGVLAAADGSGRQLQVEALIRHYTSADGSRIGPVERARLDAISARALEICEAILGPSLGRYAGHQLDSVEVNLGLDLALQSDDQAAETWGRAIADQIQRALA